MDAASEDDRGHIISAYECGFKPSVISRMLNIKTATIYKIIRRHKTALQIEAKKRSLRESQREPKSVQEMWQICHFCLNQDEETLNPITDILDSNLTIENLERFTGVTIQTNDHVVYAVCPDCTNILQNSVVFRFSCIRNDAYLREQLLLDETSPASGNVNACEDQDPLETDNDYTVFEIYEPLATAIAPDSDSQTALNTTNTPKLVDIKQEFNTIDCIKTESIQNSDSQPRLNVKNTPELLVVKEADCIEPSTIHNTSNQPILSPRNTSQQENVEEEFYSANYIEPCESTSSDSEEYETKHDETNNASCTSSMGIVPNSNKKIHIYKNGVRLFNVSVPQPKALCNMCGKFVRKLEKHMVTHTQEARYTCPHCAIKMTHEANLDRHIKAVHLKIAIKSCELCGKGLTSKSSFLSHMRSQHGIGKMYECKICQKQYKYASSVRLHYNTTHSTVYHVCATCGIGFKTRKSLRTHQAVHSSEKPYACSECPKRFKGREARRAHQMTHSGILFKCTICTKSYRYKSLLSMHLRKVHTTNNDCGE
ncbi:gastrula zinc finger protein xFG20-1-like isoform X2 [Anopheles funestus]|uniref:zinc finger protein 239-like n=1 Tax=Anopheles funestus TaxID=62324 RepID=UPI0020C6C1D1|nr:zinc finger protein 239-like [Anopheles funestus]